MKVTKVEPLRCDGGWAAFTFVKVETDAGITGYSECTDWRMPNALAGGVRDMAVAVVGQDPLAIEKLTSDMMRLAQQAPGGLIQRAIAGIEGALWDIKGKAYGVPIYELLGGPYRDRARVYWSHCATYRARYAALLGTPPLRSYDDIASLGREVAERGFSALKTNVVIPGERAEVFAPTDGNLRADTLERIESLIEAFRRGAGKDCEIALDINFYFKSEPAKRIANALESQAVMWLEVDTFDHGALREIKDSTSTAICSGESINTLHGYRPFLEARAMDIAMVDVPWTGLSQAKKIADLADTHEILVAPHNYYSHFATFMAGHFCAAIKNLRIMEIDVEGAPWRDELVTEQPQIENGHLHISDRPGWGTDLNEAALAKYPWKGNVPIPGVDTKERWP